MILRWFLIERMGFEAPTLVQAQAIPEILAGRHVYDFVPYICIFFLIFWVDFLSTSFGV